MNQSILASSPSVSVIIPVYNGERFLGEAIESLLRQTIPPREIIIVDDGSTDRTPQVAAKFGRRIRYYRQNRQGPPAARNFGIERAASEWISLLDSDDIWPDNALELQLAPIKADAAIQVVVGHALLRHDPSAGVSALPGGFPAGPRVILNLGSALILKSLFRQLGPLNADLFYCDDWDWFMRVRELGIPIHIHSGLVLYYRRHDANLTNNRKLDQYFVVQMLKQSLDRRRAANGGFARTLPHLQEEKTKPGPERRRS